MKFLEARCHELNPDGSLQIMFGIDGRHELPEQQLDGLGGYRDSHPVRVGNNAVGQLQLDIYGELIGSVYLQNKHGTPISFDLWVSVRRLVDWVCDKLVRPSGFEPETCGLRVSSVRRHWSSPVGNSGLDLHVLQGGNARCVWSLGGVVVRPVVQR
jgi:hypothetical protein